MTSCHPLSLQALQFHCLKILAPLKYFLPFIPILDTLSMIIYLFSKFLKNFYVVYPISIFGFPANPVRIVFQSYILLTVQLFAIRSTWPNKLNLWTLM